MRRRLADDGQGKAERENGQGEQQGDAFVSHGALIVLRRRRNVNGRGTAQAWANERASARSASLSS